MLRCYARRCGLLRRSLRYRERTQIAASQGEEDRDQWRAAVEAAPDRRSPVILTSYPWAGMGQVTAVRAAGVELPGFQPLPLPWAAQRRRVWPQISVATDAAMLAAALLCANV